MCCCQPLRRCIVSRVVQSREKMLRFVVSPDKHVIYDERNVLSGRGMWVSCQRRLLHQAVQKNIFSRVVRQAVYVMPEFLGVIEQSLERQCLDILGLAYRAKCVVLGDQDVRGSLAYQGGSEVTTRVLVCAKDSGQCLRERFEDFPVVVDLFSRRQLRRAIGDIQGTAVLLVYGKLARYFFNRVECLTGIRSDTPMT